MKQQNLPTLSMPLNGLTLLGIWMVATVPPPTFGRCRPVALKEPSRIPAVP